jgi:hypothetical protein
VSHSDISNDDCIHFINTFEKLKVNNRPEVIPSPYPGILYRKTLDDGKLKVFQRGDSTRIYMYPNFHPRCPRQIKENTQ